MVRLLCGPDSIIQCLQWSHLEDPLGHRAGSPAPRTQRQKAGQHLEMCIPHELPGDICIPHKLPADAHAPLGATALMISKTSSSLGMVFSQFNQKLFYSVLLSES